MLSYFKMNSVPADLFSYSNRLLAFQPIIIHVFIQIFTSPVEEKGRALLWLTSVENKGVRFFDLRPLKNKGVLFSD